MSSFHLWSDPPTPRASRRNIRDVMFRLFVGMPVKDYHRPTGSTFWRSAKAVKKRPSMNPCRDWPGWAKITWRILLYPSVPFWWNPLKYWDPKYRGIPAHELAWFFAALAVVVFCVFLYVFNPNVKRRASIPNSVPFASLPDGPMNKPYIGQTEGKKWVPLNLETEPHGVVSATTGFGKTTFLLNLILWFWSRGARIWIIDPKISSFVACLHVPNIHLPMRKQWPKIIRQFHRDMMGFYEAQYRGDEAVMNWYKSTFHALFIDEMATFVDFMKDDEGPKSPTLQLVKQIVHLGRAANFQLFIGAHQANKDVMLSTDARSNLHNRIAFGPQDRQSWQTLFEDARMKIRKKRGRGLARIGGEYVELQGVYVSENDAKEVFSTLQPPAVPPVPPPSSDVPVPADMSPEYPGTPSTSRTAVSNAGLINGDSSDESPSDNRIRGLQAGANYLELKYDTFKKARRTRPIPGEENISWTPEQLDEWNRNRKVK